jgi:hypothetical protein
MGHRQEVIGDEQREEEFDDLFFFVPHSLLPLARLNV